MLEWATDYFEKKNVPDPRLSIEWIVAEVLSCKRLDLYMQFERPLSSGELDQIRPLVKRRAAFEPLQYITGTAQFMDVSISVNPNVLIPRIETEQLVDLLLEHFQDQKDKPIKLLDIGTGSGCIPIAVKKKNPEWYCAGFDISDEAIKLSRKNAELNNINVHFFRADLLQLDQIPEKFNLSWDIIISNPPYITIEEKMEMHPQVTEYEPHLALFHQNPHRLYSSIIDYAHSNQAALYLECNDKTTSEISNITRDQFADVQVHKDLDGNPRFIVAS